ncbi:Na/Pi cotransporter family protein [Sodaliphilus sp.]|uniref:Na/Pi cotransporter family protein n=1 Tax=Sodaliphilus sp. TaxID=2815818 RepID=UPI00388E5BD6
MDYSIVDFVALIGAVCLFLYGMKVMSEGLQKAAGNGLRSILSAMTRNRFMGVVTGILITALIQSSSASTVMVVSFVNAGLMSLEQSMAVIMGANVGTTFTAWIVAIFGFKVNMGTVLMPLLAIAVPMMLMKKNKTKSIGEFLIGFVFLFMGLASISEYVPDLSKSPEIFESLKAYTSMGFLSVLIFWAVGVVVTAVIQSSAATFAIVLILASKGWVPFDMACAMVLGSKIGTTITPVLASLGGNTAAKKAAAGHVLFNVLGAVWELPCFFLVVKLIVWMNESVFGMGDPDLLYQTSNSGTAVSEEQMAQMQFSMSFAMSMFHTVLAVINLGVMIWFTKLYVKMVNFLVKSKKKNKDEEEFQLKYISGGLLNAAELNIMQAQRETVVYAQRVERMLGMVKTLVHTKTGTEEFNKLYTRIGKYEEISDRMEIEIANYLNKLVDGRLSLDAKWQVSTLLNIVSEIESIADSCNNVARTLVRKEEAQAHFSDYNYNNIDTILRYVSEAMSNMIAVLVDIENATDEDMMRTYDKEREINNFRNQCRTENIENINQKVYPYQAGIFYMDIICEAEKLGDFIVNVIDSVDEQVKRTHPHASHSEALNPEK